jgi:hypothetical protein
LASPFIRTRAREVAGHLAQRVFQGWCAISERALRTIPRLFANKKSNLELLQAGWKKYFRRVDDGGSAL